MTAPITTALLVLGAILTTLSPLAGCIVAAVGVVWQIVVTAVEVTGTPTQEQF